MVGIVTSELSPAIRISLSAGMRGNAIYLQCSELHMPCLPLKALYGSVVTPGFGAQHTRLKLPANNLGGDPDCPSVPFSYLGNADANSPGIQGASM